MPQRLFWKHTKQRVIASTFSHRFKKRTVSEINICIHTHKTTPAPSQSPTTQEHDCLEGVEFSPRNCILKKNTNTICIHIIIADLLKPERVFSVFTYQSSYTYYWQAARTFLFSNSTTNDITHSHAIQFTDILQPGLLMRFPPSFSTNRTQTDRHKYQQQKCTSVFHINKYNASVSVTFSNTPLPASGVLRRRI